MENPKPLKEQIVALWEQMFEKALKGRPENLGYMLETRYTKQNQELNDEAYLYIRLFILDAQGNTEDEGQVSFNLYNNDQAYALWEKEHSSYPFYSQTMESLSPVVMQWQIVYQAVIDLVAAFKKDAQVYPPFIKDKQE